MNIESLVLLSRALTNTDLIIVVLLMYVVDASVCSQSIEASFVRRLGLHFG
jgi:hypothetical protein